MSLRSSALRSLVASVVIRCFKRPKELLDGRRHQTQAQIQRRRLRQIQPPYPDLHDHVRALEKAGQLIRVDRPINKDTEMHPLVRWQFRGGIEEKDRKAFLFTNVTDTKGRKYDIPVLVGGLAANREIYRIGVNCPFEEIDARWVAAAARPIPPRIVTNAPCHEIVIMGKELDKPGKGLDGLPIPISTPGWDVAPYATLSQYITKDPDTGVQNMGNYRGQVKARRRLGMNPSLELRPGIYSHWERLRERGFKKLPCAVVLGAPPVVTFASVQKIAGDARRVACRRRPGRRIRSTW